MSYRVNTAVFEGPLDLLLQLITSHQVEITALSLTDLVTEYVGYLDAMRDLDMEVTSEFLLIAATLIQLKARHLLPDDVDYDLDEELALAEERDRLLSRLLACLTFKDVAAVLGHRLEVNGRYFAREVGLDPGLTPAPPALRFVATPDDLAVLLHKVENRQSREPELDHLDLDLPSVGDAIVDLRSRVAEAVETDFEAVTAHLERPIDVAAYFLALLELVRWGILRVSQEDRDGAITLRHLSDHAVGEFSSEWTQA